MHSATVTDLGVKPELVDLALRPLAVVPTGCRSRRRDSALEPPRLRRPSAHGHQPPRRLLLELRPPVGDRGPRRDTGTTAAGADAEATLALPAQTPRLNCQQAGRPLRSRLTGARRDQCGESAQTVSGVPGARTQPASSTPGTSRSRSTLTVGISSSRARSTRATGWRQSWPNHSHKVSPDLTCQQEQPQRSERWQL